MIIESKHFVTTKDSQTIAVWKIYDDSHGKIEGDANVQNVQNILLIHGAFSDKRVCLGIARYLAKIGYACYIMEWRGRGDSSIPKEPYNFETIGVFDVAATLDYLMNTLQLSNLHCITHSGGGICLTICLIQNPQYIAQIRSISLFACQAYGAALNPRSYAKTLVFKTMTKAVGYVPAKKTKMGSINESYYTMKQWYNWNLKNNFKSGLNKAALKLLNADHSQPVKAKIDYREHMPDISIPVYSISAEDDHFVAPPSGCELFLNDFKNQNNQYRNFSVNNGALEDYGHTRVFISHNAAKEIWPTVLEWIQKHSL